MATEDEKVMENEEIALYRHGGASDRKTLETYQQEANVASAAMQMLVVQIVGYNSPAEADAVIRQAWKDGYKLIKKNGGKVDEIPVPE
jgi:hypothetical protein